MERLAYSVSEVAALIGVSANTIRKEMREGKLAFKKVSGRKIIPRHCLNEYLADTGQSGSGPKWD